MARKLFAWLLHGPLLSKPGALFGLVLMLFVTIFNPFGMRDSSQQSTETWLLRMLSPFYGEAGQQEVVVVLIDDRALANMNASWPLRYSEQARLLRTLLAHQPQSIFVDILFTQRRHAGGSTDGLARVLQSADAQGIPLILADYRDAQGRSQVLQELRGAGPTAQVNWSGFGERYPLLLEHDGQRWPTPAMQVYLNNCHPAECDSSLFKAPLLVRWGFWSDPVMGRFVSLKGCDIRGARSDTAQALAMLGKDGVRTQYDADEIERPQPCPYTRTLYADQLRDPRVAEVLRGKPVFVGAHILGIPDLIASPVQGQLPGVYWHAMALDNLLTQGHTYWRSAPEVRAGVSVTNLLEMGLILVAGLVAIWIPAVPVREEGRWRRLLTHYGFWFLALSIVAVGASIALAVFWHIAPLDWLGLVLMIGLFFAYLGEPRLSAWWDGRLAHWKEKEQGDV